MKKNASWVQTSKTITFGSKKKNHKCPVCKSKLITKRNTRIIEPNSNDWANADLSMGANTRYYEGTGKFTSDEFYCEKCRKFFLPKEIYDLEKKAGGKGEKFKEALPTIFTIIGFLVIIIIGLLTNEESPFKIF